VGAEVLSSSGGRRAWRSARHWRPEPSHRHQHALLDEPASELREHPSTESSAPFCTVLTNALPEFSNHLVEPSALARETTLQDRHRLAASAMRKQPRSRRSVAVVVTPRRASVLGVGLDGLPLDPLSVAGVLFESCAGGHGKACPAMWRCSTGVVRQRTRVPYCPIPPHTRRMFDEPTLPIRSPIRSGAKRATYPALAGYVGVRRQSCANTRLGPIRPSEDRRRLLVPSDRRFVVGRCRLPEAESHGPGRLRGR
jgi:hypothetical protein